MTTTETLLTIPQAAERLGLKASTLRAWVFFRKIECVRLSPRAVRISAREVERLIAEGTIPAKGRARRNGNDLIEKETPNEGNGGREGE
jgi:excisionase family DNA binding protein